VADGALSQVTSLLNRAITLATEASNGTLNSTQEGAANQDTSRSFRNQQHWNDDDLQSASGILRQIDRDLHGRLFDTGRRSTS